MEMRRMWSSQRDTTWSSFPKRFRLQDFSVLLYLNISNLHMTHAIMKTSIKQPLHLSLKCFHSLPTCSVTQLNARENTLIIEVLFLQLTDQLFQKGRRYKSRKVGKRVTSLHCPAGKFRWMDALLGSYNRAKRNKSSGLHREIINYHD